MKLLEECALQREARAHTENQELTERLEMVMKLMQQERAELQEQHQRRLAQCQQERDREVERLRELQRCTHTHLFGKNGIHNQLVMNSTVSPAPCLRESSWTLLVLVLMEEVMFCRTEWCCT